MSTRNVKMPDMMHTPDIPEEAVDDARETADDARRAQQEANADLLVSRRSFLGGSLRAGAFLGLAGGALAASAAAMAASGCSGEDNPTPLTVSTDNITTAEELDELESYTSCVKLFATWDMPYGTIVFNSTPDLAVCLVPTDTASPLTHVYVLNPLNGDCNRVIRNAMGTDEGFEVYDARGTAKGLIWVEANIFTREWRVYMGVLDGGSLNEITMVDAGDGEWEMPSVAVSGDYGFWQVRPRLDGSHTMDDSLLKKAVFGSAMASVAFTSHGRFATPIYALQNKVVITPRNDFNNLNHYQMTLVNALTNVVEDRLCLQTGMKPVEAGYGVNGFNFSFDAIYDYGDGISNLGTYTPYEAVTDSKYSNKHWFAFVRVPTAPPCWCGNYFIVKSTTAVLGIDLQLRRYFVLDVQIGADSYGEYLATTGSSSTFVTYTNINSEPIVGKARKTCNIRVWQHANA